MKLSQFVAQAREKDKKFFVFFRVSERFNAKHNSVPVLLSETPYMVSLHDEFESADTEGFFLVNVLYHDNLCRARRTALSNGILVVEFVS